MELLIRNKKRFSDTSTTDKSPNNPNSFHIRKYKSMLTIYRLNSLEAQKRLKERKEALLNLLTVQDKIDEQELAQDLYPIATVSPKSEATVLNEEDKSKLTNTLQIPKYYYL